MDDGTCGPARDDSRLKARRMPGNDPLPVTNVKYLDHLTFIRKIKTTIREDAVTVHQKQPNIGGLNHYVRSANFEKFNVRELPA